MSFCHFNGSKGCSFVVLFLFCSFHPNLSPEPEVLFFGVYLFVEPLATHTTCMYECMLSHFSCARFSDPMDCSSPGYQSMRLSRQEYWSKLPFPSPCIQPGGNVYLLQPLSHFRAITLKCLFFVIFSNRV